jgi:cobalamin biosynthesis protein CbiG
VREAVGTASVAEAAALLAAGGRLLVPKRASRAVTVAVAEAPA